jgi:ABC-type transport system substrate-binding protein
MAAQEMFKAGQLHVYRVGRDVLYNVADSMQQTEAQLFFASTSRVAMATINPNSPQLASTELRRALQQVINIDAARATAYGTITRNAPGGVIAPGWPGGDIDRRIEFNPNAADEVRAALAGPLRIRSSGDPVMRRLTDAVAAQLRESGIETELLEPNSAALFQDLFDGAVDMTIQRSSAAFEVEDGLHFDFAYAERANPELASLGQRDLTNNIETRVAYQRLLLEMGAVLPVAEDCNVYYVAPGIAPDFSPDGEIGDLGNWDFG